MSAFGMKPTFGDLDGYRSWLKTWKALYRRVSGDIRKARNTTKSAQRSGIDEAKQQRELHYKRAMALKLNSTLVDARIRRKRIIEMKAAMAAQTALEPIMESDCRNLDFHFNKASIEFPNVLPEWTIKTKGKTYYVRTVDANVPWTTRLTDKGSTKGMIRLKKCKLRIQGGTATIDPID